MRCARRTPPHTGTAPKASSPATSSRRIVQRQVAHSRSVQCISNVPREQGLMALGGVLLKCRALELVDVRRCTR